MKRLWVMRGEDSVYLFKVDGIFWELKIITLNSRNNANQRFAQLRSAAFRVQPANENTKIKKMKNSGNDVFPSPVPQHKKAPTRKPSVCLAEVVRFQRPTRQRNARKGGQGRRNRVGGAIHEE